MTQRNVSIGRDTAVSIVNRRDPVRVVASSRGSPGLDGGDRYEISNWDSDRPASGEELVGDIFTIDVTFPAAFAASQAKASVASTGTAVYSIQKNAVEIGTLTFTASVTGVFAMAAPVTFSSGDVLSIVAPNPRDATLSGVKIKLVGAR